MNFEIKGNVGIELDKKRVVEINTKDKKIILNIRKIKGVKQLSEIIKTLTELIKKEETQEEEKEEEEGSELDKINEVTSWLKKQGYIVSIKIKGITIIKDLESSNIAKLLNKIT